MMENKPSLSHIQLRGVIVSTVVGVGVLALPGHLTRAMGSDGWIAIIISVFLIMAVVYMYHRLFLLYPEMDYFQIQEEVLGKPIARIFQLIFLIFFIMFAAIVSRNLGELMKAFLLNNTPTEIIVILFILACSYISCYGVEYMARVGYFIYPVIILFAIAIVLMALPKADFTNILPVFNDVTLGSLSKGVMACIFSFSGFEASLFIIPYVREKDKIVGSLIRGIITVGVIYASLYIMSLSHFSQNQIKKQTYPVLVLVRQLDLPGFFLENLDGVVIALWILVIFATMVPALWGVGNILARMTGTRKHYYFTLGIIPIVYYIALMSENFLELMELTDKYFNPMAIISGVIIPFILLITGMIKRRVME